MIPFRDIKEIIPPIPPHIQKWAFVVPRPEDPPEVAESMVIGRFPGGRGLYLVSSILDVIPLSLKDGDVIGILQGHGILTGDGDSHTLAPGDTFVATRASDDWRIEVVRSKPMLLWAVHQYLDGAETGPLGSCKYPPGCRGAYITEVEADCGSGTAGPEVCPILKIRPRAYPFLEEWDLYVLPVWPALAESRFRRTNGTRLKFDVTSFLSCLRLSLNSGDRLTNRGPVGVLSHEGKPSVTLQPGDYCDIDTYSNCWRFSASLPFHIRLEIEGSPFSPAQILDVDPKAGCKYPPGCRDY